MENRGEGWNVERWGEVGGVTVRDGGGHPRREWGSNARQRRLNGGDDDARSAAAAVAQQWQ